MAASNAPGATAMAINVVQGSTGDLVDDDGEPETTGQGLPGVTFGVCPEVTKTGSITANGMELTVDFGDEPCTALAVDENSPATGQVSISMEDGPSISTDLYELEQWAEMILGQ